MPPALRTLVISDLHLGNRAHHDVLRLPGRGRGCSRRCSEIDRLVLLGDIVELMTAATRAAHGRRRAGAAGDRPALGAGREVIIVPGNHDAPAGARVGAPARATSVGGSRRCRPTRARRWPGSCRGWPPRGCASIPGGVADGSDLGDPRPLPRPPSAPRVGVRSRCGGRALGHAAGAADRLRARRRRPRAADPLWPGCSGAPAATARGPPSLSAPRRCRVPRLLLQRAARPGDGGRDRPPDAARQHPGAGARGAPARDRRGLGGVRPRPPRSARCPVTALIGGERPTAGVGASGSSTPARGCTSRSWWTAPRRRTRTGRAAPSCSSRAPTRAPSACSMGSRLATWRRLWSGERSPEPAPGQASAR